MSLLHSVLEPSQPVAWELVTISRPMLTIVEPVSPLLVKGLRQHAAPGSVLT
jgi:hypothetical protein